ncbi:phospholipid-translocating p-type flippase family protein [Stylonychia lemnae]|uniref:Phospholipid-transporting ATPase n=1 Tax=Stylonychia lemnae TaxID=5949 RepID=A0A078AAJ6_STYLE|nr:phospholipid-translocating p-type flippase family protein [Stylonychia lemnae]|eukprot:CDW78607.1 phospholipid-translocating p-type flippase family protein [Stylonychia lemnae]
MHTDKTIMEPLLDRNDPDSQNRSINYSPDSRRQTIQNQNSPQSSEERKYIHHNSMTIEDPTIRQVQVFPNLEEYTPEYLRHHQRYRDNSVKTSKYTFFTFLPKNLLEQFSKLANVYFLLIAFMQMIPIISISGGKPVMLMPLAFVIIVSMIKDIFEDYKRHKSDKAENFKQVEVFDQVTKTFKLQHWKSLKVGMVVKVKQDQFFPADLVLLKSSESKGVCYVETKNLDGETNLKHKIADKALNKKFEDSNAVQTFRCGLVCEEANDLIYKFEGTIFFGADKRKSLSSENIVLRGSSLKNTEFVIGFIVYAGHQTKIMMNSTGAKFKMSRIERETNKQILIVFIVQVICCFIGAIIGTIYQLDLVEDQYLGLQLDASTWPILVQIIKQTGTWILIFTNFVPISLLVTLEVVKFLQAIFISWDANMIDDEQMQQAGVQASNLNEELGQIEYLFSDKTGTLTQNIMEFKKFSAGNFSYGMSNPTNPEAKSIENVNFQDETFWDHYNNKTSVNYEDIEKVVLHLALCHTIILDERTGKYNASSPDELALVNAAKFFGAVFKKRDEENYMIVDFRGQILKYKLLNILEFNSTRKRMSVIVQDSNGRILLLCKGADSIILPRLNPATSPTLSTTQGFVDQYAEEGLRTLLLAQKYLNENEYNQWNQLFEGAMASVSDRDQKLAEINEQIEKQMDLIGSTAIEDKLQDGVNETIRFMRDAGIKVWVLTGDKVETAINIGYSSGLLDNNMDQYQITETNVRDLNVVISNSIGQAKAISSLIYKKALIVAGDSLNIIFKEDPLKKIFLELSDLVDVVLACRVSPKQKADIVAVIRERFPLKTTLSIGDGANDVNMITTAHVGVGISGLEGQQAARSADFVISQFRFLKPLLFVHGREAYRRNAFLVCYNFYKNALFVLPQYWFGFFSAFSGQTLYEAFIYQLYNIMFSSVPIVWYAIFDFQHTKEYFLTTPKSYDIGLKNKCFGTRVFWLWFANGAFSAAVVLFVGLYAMEVSLDEEGKTNGLYISGSVVYAGVVIIANMKILNSLNIFGFWCELLVFLSILVYFLVLLIESQIISFPEIFGLFGPIMGQPVTYFSLLFMLFLTSTVDKITTYVTYQIINYKDNKEELKMLKEKSFYEKIPVPTRSSTMRRNGYAFAQEDHATPQLMEKLQSGLRKKLLQAKTDQQIQDE